jgi:hypothetical protein
VAYFVVDWCSVPRLPDHQYVLFRRLDLALSFWHSLPQGHTGEWMFVFPGEN